MEDPFIADATISEDDQFWMLRWMHRYALQSSDGKDLFVVHAVLIFETFIPLPFLYYITGQVHPLAPIRELMLVECYT